MKQWTEERCAERPEELQLVAPNIFIQRRNITEQHHVEKDGMEKFTDFVCESREITESELAMLQSFEEIQTEKEVENAIDKYTAELIQEGVLA